MYKTDPDAPYTSFDMGNQTSFSAKLAEGSIYYVAIQAYNSTAFSNPSNIGYIGIPKHYLNLGHIGNDLTLYIPCAQYQGNQYRFTLNYSPTLSDPLRWKIDSSFTQIHNSPTPALFVGDDLKLNLSAEYGGVEYSFGMNHSSDPNDPLTWKSDFATVKHE